MREFELIVLRGASGVGKSTLLNALKANLNRTYCIDIDDIRDMLANMDWENGFDDYVNSQKIVMAMVAEINNLGYNRVIVSDVFPLSILYPFVSKSPWHYRVINLYCNREELVCRLKQRNRKIIRIENIISFNESIMNNDMDKTQSGAKDILYIDTTSISTQSICEQLKKWI